MPYSILSYSPYAKRGTYGEGDDISVFHLKHWRGKNTPTLGQEICLLDEYTPPLLLPKIPDGHHKETIRQHLFDFRGRTNRKHYLITLLSIAAVSGIITLLTPFPVSLLVSQNNRLTIHDLFINITHLIALCLTIIPTIRRYHDLNKSGWYCLYNQIPFVSVFAYLYCLFAKGQDGANQWGYGD